MKIFPVTELHHVQNLITSVILRQTKILRVHFLQKMAREGTKWM